ncbi:MAG: FAD-linked oxidase [Hyphomicrobiales bacterium]|nr:MAG: FAD-linked oxidase [Hyphomicrobiales bacterium]
MTDFTALKAELEGLDFDDTPVVLKQKSRDFFWYSPILKRHLDQASADLVVKPRSEQEIIRILAACYRHEVPVTVRGAGTGNYGQAVPLAGGVVLDMSAMTGITAIRPGSVHVEPGALMADIDEALRPSGQELRIVSSTVKTATVGGFVAGGIGGLGTVRWGGLRDLGNVIGARIVTMEAEPQIIELHGAQVLDIVHAYGTTGVITRLEMAVTAAYDWVDVLIGFDSLMTTVRFADHLATMDGILLKELGVVAAPLPYEGFLRYQHWIPRDMNVATIMVAPHALAALESVASNAGGAVLFRSDTVGENDRAELPPVAELVWNHTTLRALRTDPSLTYLQVLYPPGDHLKKIETLLGVFGDELLTHLEFVRFDGRVAVYGIPVVRYTTEERLDEIIAIFEEHGCPVFNPHRCTLEEGGMKEIDRDQLAFKQRTDPKGLLNPGKMIGWDEPDYDFSRPSMYLFSKS